MCKRNDFLNRPKGGSYKQPVEVTGKNTIVVVTLRVINHCRGWMEQKIPREQRQ